MIDLRASARLGLVVGVAMFGAGCSTSTPIKNLCQAAAHVASANTNLADALTAMERSDARLFAASIELAKTDVGKAVELTRQVPSSPPGMLPGTVSALAEALDATSALVVELPSHDSAEVAELRLRVDDAQFALDANPGLPDACTDPVRPPIELSS